MIDHMMEYGTGNTNWRNKINGTNNFFQWYSIFGIFSGMIKNGLGGM